MHWAFRVTAVLVTAYAVVHGQPTQLDDDAVREAFLAGRYGKHKRLVSDCMTQAGYLPLKPWKLTQPTGSFYIVVSRAPGLIAATADYANRAKQPFSVDKVTPEMRDLTKVFVSAWPRSPVAVGYIWTEIASRIRRVVLRSKSDPTAEVKPEATSLTKVEWEEHAVKGPPPAAYEARATFRHADVRAMPAGDIDVVLLTQDGERRCKVGSKDRARVLD